MSRKELVLKLVMELEKWGNEGSSVYHARHLAPFIERLLAQEREPMECGHPKACWVELKTEAPDGSVQGYAVECSACTRLEAELKPLREALRQALGGGVVGEALRQNRG